MVLVDAAVPVTICCLTYWTEMRIIAVTFEFADVSLHNWVFYFVRSSMVRYFVLNGNDAR